jgi:hypothetical protein
MRGGWTTSDPPCWRTSPRSQVAGARGCWPTCATRAPFTCVDVGLSRPFPTHCCGGGLTVLFVQVTRLFVRQQFFEAHRRFLFGSVMKGRASAPFARFGVPMPDLRCFRRHRPPEAPAGPYENEPSDSPNRRLLVR